MVGQSDLPFRQLVGKYGATLAYTQMLRPDKLLEDQDYLEFHQRSLEQDNAPVVVQLCGNDPDTIIKGGRKLERLCSAIGNPYSYLVNSPSEE